MKKKFDLFSLFLVLRVIGPTMLAMEVVDLSNIANSVDYLDYSTCDIRCILFVVF